jgi:Transposase domain (DUF772)
MHNLSDEDLCARWVENPYYRLFCGEEFFRHKLIFDRSSLTRWRQRMGEEKLVTGEPRGGRAHWRGQARRLFQGESWTPACSPRRWPFRPTPSSCIEPASGW